LYFQYHNMEAERDDEREKREADVNANKKLETDLRG
jgi:hypothetical protein